MWAVLQEVSGKRSLVTLKGKAKVGKQWVKLSSELGFYRTYQVVDGEPQEYQVENPFQGKVTRDNRGFADSNTAQSLAPEEILQIRQQEGGQHLVEQLVSNSATFDQKNEFAQEKYLKKKKQKHMGLFKLLPASLANVADTLHEHKPLKYMRSEALMNLLCLGNVHSHLEVGVAEDTGGLVLGGVLSRTTSQVVSLGSSGTHALKYLGFKENSARIQKDLQDLDSLIVASKQLKQTIENHIDKLKAGGTLAAFSHDMVEAALVFDWLLNLGSVINVAFEEVWVRDLQVLPDRTHPVLSHRNGTSGGYLVSGVKVNS